MRRPTARTPRHPATQRRATGLAANPSSRPIARRTDAPRAHGCPNTAESFSTSPAFSFGEVWRYYEPMSAILTAYLPGAAAETCLLRNQQRVQIGRGSECDWCLDHPSISRQHAEITREGENWRLRDCGSKNGCYVEGVRTTGAILDHAAWLRFGDIHCEFTPLDLPAAERLEQRSARRRQSSITLAGRIAQHTALPDVLDETLRSVVELAECERGFILLNGPDGLRVRSCHGLNKDELRTRRFAGSMGAAMKSLTTGAAVVHNSLASDVDLAQRESIVDAGLRALVCLPLRIGGAVVGVVYADTRGPGSAITALDLELLVAFVERAALWMEARRGQEILAGVSASQPPTAIADGGDSLPAGVRSDP